MDENLLDIKQTATYLKMNKMTIYKLARQGRIPAFKVASEWRFKKELIDQWLFSQLKGNYGQEEFKPEEIQTNKMIKSILIVDDEAVIRDFFSRVLTEYKVYTASNGTEALNIIKNNKPDLVLLDINMPGIDGIETLRQIKSVDKNIEVIMLSAFGTVKTSMVAAKLGAYDSMSKPFDLEEIKSVIKGALCLKEEKSV